MKTGPDSFSQETCHGHDRHSCNRSWPVQQLCVLARHSRGNTRAAETDGRGRITRRGPRLLRAVLVECAWYSLPYNAWARDTWLRLQANGLSKRKAIVALAR